MYRAFNLTGHPWGNVSRTNGDAIFNATRATVKQSLESFLNGEIVDGTKLTAHWFPTVKADVFISHSHQDEEAAIKCAGWLKSEFDLDPFIDSSVWGYAEDLLKIIDDQYCRISDSPSYSYEMRNRSTSHVHMMLSTALSAMLDSTECVIFINTPNSITSSESIAKTQSPWLSFELGTMRVIRRKEPARKGLQIETFANRSDEIVKAARFAAEYTVSLSELTPLDSETLNQWRQAHQTNAHRWKTPLDLLYNLAPEITKT